jgi:hypothetical protein
MQLAALQSVMSAEVASVLVTCSRYSLAVSSGLLRSSGRRRPSFFVKRTCSSSHELGSASEQMTNPNPPWLPKKQWHLPWSFVPHRDNSTLGPQTTSIHAHLCSAHSVSHALDGLLPREPCELISSRYHVQDSLFRGFPCRQADPSHRWSVPS